MTRDLPFQHLDVYHSFKFMPEQLEEGVEVKDVVKALPLNGGRFDTVVVITGDVAEGVGLAGTRIGHIKVIFRLPSALQIIGSYKSAAPTSWSKAPLAYIEWYTVPTLTHLNAGGECLGEWWGETKDDVRVIAVAEEAERHGNDNYQEETIN
ncbi:hypothetical protein BDP27DRAFT_1435761 [Rhodocollybia butyracea]|uniref:Uncharacterized protein n=1 Tax=Rhodocollybia butyracea TaxID=206335 RepID=A0A9P5P753_9AGAR|nr:hypothetical protein BDP27DRAFT_1435761 [Rhodocollybia butyracea]